MRIILFVVLIVIFFTSCESTAEIDLPPHESLLVLNSLFTPDSILWVRVTHSKSVFDNSPIEPVTNASVDLLDESGNSVGTMLHQGDGVYRLMTSFHPLPGTSYTINASAAGYPAVHSVDRIPAPVPITGYSVHDSARIDAYGVVMAGLDVTFDDPAEKNYYLLEYVKADTSDPSSPLVSKIQLMTFSDEAGNVEVLSSAIAFDDEFNNGKTCTLKALFYSSSELVHPVPGSHEVVYIRLLSVSRDYYLYKKTHNIQAENEGNPFSEPVQVHSNIAGGFGIFAGYSADTMTVK